jgi:AcrR family transcriptional regulator
VILNASIYSIPRKRMKFMEHEHIHSRRARRILKKRGEILDAATHVFSEKGYASTTTKEIAEKADMGESTL